MGRGARRCGGTYGHGYAPQGRQFDVNNHTVPDWLMVDRYGGAKAGMKETRELILPVTVLPAKKAAVDVKVCIEQAAAIGSLQA